MDTDPDHPDHGFQFPGRFELSAMGPASAGLEHELPRLLMEAGIDVESESIRWSHSSSGKFVSVKVRFHAADRAQHDRAHEVLRGHPEVKWTL